MQETWAQSLGQEDPLEEDMAIDSSWEISWTEEPGSLPQPPFPLDFPNTQITTRVSNPDLESTPLLSTPFPTSIHLGFSERGSVAAKNPAQIIANPLAFCRGK